MSARKRLLLVGWDSADWKIIHPLLDAGLMPGVRHLVEEGVSGNLSTLEPQLSPMLWTSIATGKMAYHHGVLGFTDVDPVSGQVVPVSAATRRCKTLWEIFSQRGLKSHVVGWFATQGETGLNGCMVSNMFVHLGDVKPHQPPDQWPAPPPGTYWPESLAQELDELRVSPWEIDPDKVLRLFVPNAPAVDQDCDSRLWILAQQLAQAYSIQSAATYLMETQGDWDFMAVYFRALDEIKHYFMHYHPPRMEGIPQQDFEMYNRVVTTAYLAHDMMLQRLMQLAGPDAAVVLVSDHGFHSDQLRPKFTPRVPAGIAVWHRPQGVLAACGAGLKRDELIFGARLLDIAPTVLHYFDLPLGQDMEGRVLTEAFDEPRAVATIPTWETPDQAQRVCGTLSQEQSRALLEQFAALGYIDTSLCDPTQAAAITRRENTWNLARACLYSGRYEQALELLEQCHAADGDRVDYAQMLAQCQLRLGLLEEAQATLETALAGLGRTEGAHLIRANVAIEKKDFDEALRQLEIVQQRHADEPQVLLPLARTYLELRRWDDADRAVQAVLRQDPNSPQAWMILARLQLHRDEPGQAVQSALHAIGYQYGNPQGHFLLGSALAAQRDWANARTALANCLRLDADNMPAYRQLAHVLRMLGQEEEALTCQIRADAAGEKAQTRKRAQLERVRAALALRAAQRQAAPPAARPDQPPAGADADGQGEVMEFVLVSGLPRSGTSLMMQMLQAGGMELMTDHQRTPDQDNPEGYWEWEQIKKLPQDPRVLEQTRGKVVKVISALLGHLPPRHRYKIVFMRRPEREVVRSQWKMLEHRGMAPKSEAMHLEQTQATHVRQVLARLRESDRVKVLEVDYPSLVADPAPWIERLREFLGHQVLPSPEKMAGAVKQELYRNRQDA